MKPSIKSFTVALSLIAGTALQAQFLVPTWATSNETDNMEFAWWFGFSDPYTDWSLPDVGETVDAIPENEGNLSDYDDFTNSNTNPDAILVQNGNEAIIAGSGGIYLQGGPGNFVIYDDPGYDAGSILLQTRSLAAGTAPDISSALLYFRTEEDGELQTAVAPIGSGFLYNGDSVYATWEWDLSAYSIFDYFITFASDDSAISLQEVWLDTTDIASRQLGYALTLDSNAAFGDIGTIEHHLSGETEPELSYQIGDQIDLTAIADPEWGHTFMGWSGDASGSSNPITITMAEGRTVNAIFSPTTYTYWSWNNINSYTENYSARLQPTADPDFNGLSNFMEYALGGAPETSDEVPVRPQVGISEDGDHIEVTFRRQPVATDVAYTIKVSSDLETWNYNGDGTGLTYTEFLAASVTLNDDGTETVTYRDLTPIPSGGTRFIYVEVTEVSES